MSDIDTNTNINSISNSIDTDDLKGRQKIIINATYEDFINDPISVIENNISDINKIRNYLLKYKKSVSSILEKIRTDGSSTNNIFISNFAHEFVEFKKGFTV